MGQAMNPQLSLPLPDVALPEAYHVPHLTHSERMEKLLLKEQVSLFAHHQRMAAQMGMSLEQQQQYAQQQIATHDVKRRGQGLKLDGLGSDDDAMDMELTPEQQLQRAADRRSAAALQARIRDKKRGAMGKIKSMR